jgi:hypothetical protein
MIQGPFFVYTTFQDHRRAPGWRSHPSRGVRRGTPVVYCEKTEAEAKALYTAITADPDGVLKWIMNYW